MYNEVININLKPLKTFKTEDISEENNFIDIKKYTENKKEISKDKENITEIKKPIKEVKKKIETNNTVNNFQEIKEKDTKPINNNLSKKKRESSQLEVISQEQDLKEKKISNTSNNVASNEEIKNFNNYNNELKALIKKKATDNYPRMSLRKREEGIVELNFSINMNGYIKNIKIGKKTKAPQRLINASISTLELISPYKKNPILKKNNTFSIIIVYKLQ